MPQKILVAEKDLGALNLIETRLRARGYEVYLATQSDEVSRLIEKVSFDLVFLSSSMERSEGMGLAERVKHSSAGLKVPIILLAEEGELSELVLSSDRGFDDFLIKPFDALSLQLRVVLNLTRARERLQANPLTNLPGSVAISEHLERRIDRKEIFSVCYIDINHFKSFNDRYGFDQGDTVIQHLAKLIARVSEHTGASRSAFVGHIGGDDFIVVLDCEFETRFAEECLQEFDRIIPAYYDEIDRKRKSVLVKNRNGVPVSYPLMSLAIAAVTNQHRSYRSMAEIARDAAEVKAYLKTQPGSHYLRDRRSKPLESLDESCEMLRKSERRAKKSKLLGQLALEGGLITDTQLAQAVRRHVETGAKLGQVLVRMNFMKSADLGRLLEKKLGIDYVNLSGRVIPGELEPLFNEEWMSAYRSVPLSLTGSRLELAMADPFDQPAIQAIEKISGFQVTPKFALENELDEFLEARRTRQ